MCIRCAISPVGHARDPQGERLHEVNCTALARAD
jgi:hypothetical protein